MNPNDLGELQALRAMYPAEVVYLRDGEPVPVDDQSFAFINLPNGVLCRPGVYNDVPFVFIPDVHVNHVEPYGDADEPKAGYYFEKIPRLMLDPSIVTNEPQVAVTEGDWANPDHKPTKVEGDF
jgi:hypothetical protein